MNTNRQCGCKGFNSCFTCETEFGITASDPTQDRINQFEEEREFCILCSRLFVNTGYICSLIDDFMCLIIERILIRMDTRGTMQPRIFEKVTFCSHKIEQSINPI